MNLIIAGLRRSGTTVFWGAFRPDPGFTAFDEPFNPALATLPAEHPKRIRKEYIDLIDQDGDGFWASFAPITVAEELERGLNEGQRSYLSYLASRAERVVLDTTRCHFKIGDLAATVPDSVFVHLYRAPVAFASSHLLPSGSSLRRRVRLAARKRRFWAPTIGYDQWLYQTLIGDHSSSPFGERMTDAGMDSDAIYALPPAGRLLALWKVCHDEAERAGLEHFGERFVSLPFDRFAAQPDAVVDLVYDVLQVARPERGPLGVRRASPGFAPGDPRWQELATTVGIEMAESAEVRVGGDVVGLE